MREIMYGKRGNAACTNVLFIVILFLSMLTRCGQESRDDVTLVFPTGRYVNWINFELIDVAFKLHNDSLWIDSNYDSETKKFVIRGIERSEYFPATTRFLKMNLAEYKTLSLKSDSTSCSRLTPVHLEYKSGREIKMINFRTIAECNVNKDSIPDIVRELWMLKQKYAR